ncbi:MAG: DUF4912 domain-containing protein [Verrucomicrobiota bacterium]
MKPEKKKTPSKPVSGAAKKSPTLRKKIVAVDPEPASEKGAKEIAVPEAKPASDKMKSAVQFVRSAAKRAVRATRKVKGAMEESKPLVGKAIEPVLKAAMEIPSILLEGDAPSASAPSGPGQRYSLGPVPPGGPLATEGELPEAYGTQKLLLTARDPHWLYAHWDFTLEQLRKYNALARDGHLVLRVFKNKIAGKAHAEIQVHPESRNWFVHVEAASTKYMAEIGYPNLNGDWTRISASGATMTPPDSLSEDTSVRFATIPVDVPFEELIRIVKAAVRESIPLAEAIMQLRAQGFKNLPEPSKFSSMKWTAAQQLALGALITMDSVRRVWIGSLEITELIRRQLMQDVSSMGAAQFSLPSSISVSSLSSPFGGMQKQKKFWFNVNAELIIYGATEPDAKVEIGGRKIQLRPDGTFSFRFILPDGNYDLPAQATSADGDDTRSAHLKFSRATKYAGEVGAHPQDSRMKTPEVVNVS